MANVATKSKTKNAASKKPKRRDGSDLKEQVLSLGGEISDLNLLKDVEGGDAVVTGEQENDLTLVKDVSTFLSDLKLGKEPTSRDAGKIKNKTAPKDRTEKKAKGKQPIVHDSGHAAASMDAKETSSHTSLPKGSHKLVFPPGPHWYSAVSPLPPTDTSSAVPSASQLSSLNEKAANLLHKDAEVYQTSSASTGHSTSDSHFLQTILAKGTLSDRLSALTLLVQASPVHNIKALENLKNMAERGRGKGGREEGLKAMRCVIDWWVGGGAPGWKLRYFRDQPQLLHPSASNEHLIMWHFEDWLKKFFFSVLQILETYSLDTLPYVRTQALGFIFTLLRDKPEQEQNLLRLLVNKLGDTEKSVCSRASYHILQLLQSHPNMKSVIVREIRSLIFRPAASTSAEAQNSQKAAAEKAKVNTHIKFTDEDSESVPKDKSKDKGKKPQISTKPMERWNSHAWYYASVTLNQVVLTPSEHDRGVSRVLIEVYFEMFKEVLGGTVESKEHEDEGSVVDASEPPAKGKRRTKGKEKEVRGAAGFVEVEDSNSRLVSAILSGVNRALPFAKVDFGGDEVFKKHIDTLFLITHKSTFNISLQALMLILQVISTLSTALPSSSEGNTTATSLSDRFYRTLYASLSDHRLSTSNKQAMYLNLLFKSLKVDTNIDRVKAFVRRFVQILVIGIGGAGGTEFVAGGLYLLGELFSTRPQLKEMLSSLGPEKTGDEVEQYDPRKRDPQYSHASSSPLYELLPLLHHYHPAISLHARQLLTSAPLTATADLSLNTLSHFLDRFVYKNPKKPKTKGASAMQPAATSADGASGVKLIKGEATGKGVVPVNEERWWKRKVEDVPVDELFFHKFFSRKNEMEKAKVAKVEKRKGRDEDSSTEASGNEDEDEDVEEPEGGSDEKGEGSDEEEAEIWQAMKSTIPAELQDDDLDDDTDGMPSDLEGDDSEEEGGEESEDDVSEDEHQDNGSDAISLAEASDAEDLLPLDADIPEGLVDYDGPDAGSGGDEEEEWGGISGSQTQPNKRKRGEEDKRKRKKLRSLPTFASYEDYAKLIEDGEEDNV